MLPVLIGSAALKEHGYLDTIPNDYDIILSKEQSFDIILNCDSKKGTPNTGITCKFGCINVDLFFTNKHESDAYAYGYGNTYGKCHNIEHIGDVNVAPLFLLYVLKKSHIHRMVPQGNEEDTAIEWHKQVKQYIWMRNKLGYEIMDAIIFGTDPYSDILTVNDEYSELRTILIKRFEETNNRIGDAQSMDKDEGAFFKDNVKRYIDHDELHRIVAQQLRGTDILLFENIKEENNAQLDKDKFFKMNYNDRIAMFREEIIVLLLERKWIPTAIDCGYKKKKESNAMIDLKIISANYITNLCGNGHYWLRRYVIDHYAPIMNCIDFEKIDIILRKIVDVKFIENKGQDFFTFLQNNNPLPNFSTSKFFKRYPFELDELKINGIKYKNVSKSTSTVSIKFYLPQIIFENLKNVNTFIVNEIPRKDIYYIYDPMQNFGVMKEKNNKYTLFRFYIEKKCNDASVKINVETYSNAEKEITEDNYSIIQNCEYTHSYGCEWAEERDYKELSSYGNANKKFKQIMEDIALYYFNMDDVKEYCW